MGKLSKEQREAAANLVGALAMLAVIGLALAWLFLYELQGAAIPLLMTISWREWVYARQRVELYTLRRNGKKADL